MSNEVAELKGTSLAANPFGNLNGAANVPAPSSGNALMTSEMQRSIAEVQAATMMAISYPRFPQQAVDKILTECQRHSLAEVAIYSFPRGGQQISGPSIRLAEVIKRHWRNMRSGWRCLERRKGVSLLQAYAYDLENNVSEMVEFEVRHVRDTKQGPKPITDERDIYELEANQAKRRERACILALVDGDVVEVAVQQCEMTLEAKADTSAEGVKRMLEAFAPFKVNQKMIEARIGRNITSIQPAQMVGLKTVLNSLKDGMSSIEQWFDISLQDRSKDDSKNDAPDGANASLKNKISEAKKDGDKAEKAKEPEAKKDDAKQPALPKDIDDLNKAIGDALTEASSVDAIDAVWNNHLEAIERIKGADASAFANLDAIYLKRRDALDNKGKSQGKLV